MQWSVLNTHSPVLLQKVLQGGELKPAMVQTAVVSHLTYRLTPLEYEKPDQRNLIGLFYWVLAGSGNSHCSRRFS
jgi:hypothetical protein